MKLNHTFAHTMLLKLLLTTAIVLTPTIARADWMQLASSTEGTLLYIDPNSITRYGSFVTFSVKLIGEQQVEEYSVASCETGYFQPQELIVNNIRQHPRGKSFPVHEARMGSLYGAAVNYACSEH